MNRREALTNAAALAALAAAGSARADDMPTGHEHHHMAQAPGANLANAASACVQKGQACIDHCLVLLGQGDQSMAACAQTVTQMLAICAALQRLANADSKFTPRLAKIAYDVCTDCAAECKKHADQHTQCKECMESCLACAKECQKISA